MSIFISIFMPVEITVIDKLIAHCDKRGNGVIDIEEVAPALTMWYQMVEDDDDTTVTSTYGEKGGDDKEQLLKPGGNSCPCVIS
jgi:hypothetical protein